MRRNRTIRLAATLGCAILFSSGGASAQETAPAPKAAVQTEGAADGTTKPQSSAKPSAEAYHLEFSINELEDGKKINSRQYSMYLIPSEPVDIKIGTRVPVEAKEGEFQYLDVGTSLSARIGESRGQTELIVRADLSNFAVPEPNQEKRDLHPIVRQVKMGGSVLLPLTKTIVLDSVDDPNSKRQFQLEVTVTKLR